MLYRIAYSATLASVVLSIVVAGVPARKLAQSDTPSPPKSDDSKPWWMYVVIPVISAVVGWFTNVLALQMTFYPLEFTPSFLAFTQIPEQPIGWLVLFGWQGIIPSKAPKMAEIVTRLMTTKLIDVQEVFGRLDPKLLAQDLKAGMETSMEKVIDEVMMQEAKGTWQAAPSHVKKEVVNLALSRSADFTAGLIKEMQVNIYEVLDMIGMNRRLAKERKEKIVQIFQEVGAEEFTFIEHSGFYFGFLFGLLQTLIYAFYDAVWVLPAAGFIVGFATNYLALLLIFKPVQPKRLCGLYTLHGAFLKRQQHVSAHFAQLLGDLFVNAEHMWFEILNGKKKEEFRAMFRKYAFKFADQEMGVAKILLKAVIGDEAINRVMKCGVEALLNEFGNIIPFGYKYTDKALDIKNTLEYQLKKLPPADFEGVLHPAFEEDEFKLIVVGGALGACAGLLQEFVLFGDLLW